MRKFLGMALQMPGFAYVRIFADDADGKKAFGATKIGPVPSMVLTYTPHELNTSREDILLCYPSASQSHPPPSLS